MTSPIRSFQLGVVWITAALFSATASAAATNPNTSLTGPSLGVEQRLQRLSRALESHWNDGWYEPGGDQLQGDLAWGFSNGRHRRFVNGRYGSAYHRPGRGFVNSHGYYGGHRGFINGGGGHHHGGFSNGRHHHSSFVNW